METGIRSLVDHHWCHLMTVTCQGTYSSASNSPSKLVSFWLMNVDPVGRFENGIIWIQARLNQKYPVLRQAIWMGPKVWPGTREILPYRDLCWIKEELMEGTALCVCWGRNAMLPNSSQLTNYWESVNECSCSTYYVPTLGYTCMMIKLCLFCTIPRP